MERVISVVRPRRRRALQWLLAVGGGLGTALSVAGPPRAWAQSELLTASGAGVNVKEMPGAEGGEPVPLRESFAFDPHYAQCIIEDNMAAFVMDTNEMGQVVIDPHSFFMAMYATELNLVGISRGPGRTRVAKLAGKLDCSTEAGVASITVGSRTATEAANFEIEAVDGGQGGPGDRFAFTVFFDPDRAPLNHAMFGPSPTFTGRLVAGRVSIGPPVLRPPA